MHFSFAGGQVRSLLSLISYFGKGENRERYLGVKIPPTSLEPDYLEQVGAFAIGLADDLVREVGGDEVLLMSSRNGEATDTTKVSAHE
jgi:hypothetical protein